MDAREGQSYPEKREGPREYPLEGPSLSSACYAAFAAVMVVLAFLAVVIHLVSLVFPARQADGDPAVVAAIAAAARHAGAQVTHIEEAP